MNTNQDEVREKLKKKFLEDRDRNIVAFVTPHDINRIADWWLQRFDTLLASKDARIKELEDDINLVIKILS